MKIQNILVPVDFSACSKNALRIAISVAKKYGAKIHMVNAIHLHTHPDVIGGNIISSIINDYEVQVQKSFNELEAEIIELLDVPHEADRFTAYLVDAIYTECERKEIDLIIMGTRAEHDTLDKILGSRTTDVIESADVPVLVVPENITIFDPKTIGFASDFQKIPNSRKLDILQMLAVTYEAEILVFHVSDKPEQITREEQKAMDHLSARLEGCVHSIRTVQAGSVSEGIKEFTSWHKLDLLVMIHRKHSFFERIFKKSVTKNVAIDYNTPLLTLHEI